MGNSSASVVSMRSISSVWLSNFVTIACSVEKVISLTFSSPKVLTHLALSNWRMEAKAIFCSISEG